MTRVTNSDIEAARALNNHPIDVTITFKLNEGMLHGHVVAAVEGKSNRWARIDVGEHQPGWRNYLTAKFTITQNSNGTAGAVQGQTYELSLDKLKTGLAVLATEYPHHFKNIIAEDGDSTTGDMLVQYALFGTIVYE